MLSIPPVKLPVIENKVTAASATAAASMTVTNFILWVLGHYFNAGVPSEVVNFVNVATAAAGAFIGGFIARHTPRPMPATAADERNMA